MGVQISYLHGEIQWVSRFLHPDFSRSSGSLALRGFGVDYYAAEFWKFPAEAEFHFLGYTMHFRD